MKKVISIEYCTSWGYLPRAVALVRNILSEHTNKISEVIVIPSSGGVFEVKLNDELLFSKKELDRFPEKDEAENMIKERL